MGYFTAQQGFPFVGSESEKGKESTEWKPPDSTRQ
jgi:hypothetical protein